MAMAPATAAVMAAAAAADVVMVAAPAAVAATMVAAAAATNGDGSSGSCGDGGECGDGRGCSGGGCGSRGCSDNGGCGCGLLLCAAHLHRLLTQPPASSAKRRANWLQQAQRSFSFNASPPRGVRSKRLRVKIARSSKSSGTVKNHNSLIICVIKTTSVADGINLASSGTP